MQAAKITAYYFLWFIYYVLCFFIDRLDNLQMSGSIAVTGVTIALMLCTFASPFYVAPLILKLYTGNDKPAHLKRWSGTLSAAILVLFIGSLCNVYLKGFNTDTLALLPFYAFNLCLIISLSRIKE